MQGMAQGRLNTTQAAGQYADLSMQYGAVLPQMAQGAGAINSMFAQYGMTPQPSAYMATVSKAEGGGGFTAVKTNFLGNLYGTQTGYALRKFRQAGGGEKRSFVNGTTAEVGMNAFGGQGWQYGGMEYSPTYGLQQGGYSDITQGQRALGAAQAAWGVQGASINLQQHEDMVALTKAMRPLEKAMIDLSRSQQSQSLGFARSVGDAAIRPGAGESGAPGEAVAAYRPVGSGKSSASSKSA